MGGEPMGAEVLQYDEKTGAQLTAPAVPAVTLPEYVLDGARERGRTLALVDAATGAELSYADLPGTVAEQAAGLAGSGVRPGDVLALCAPNGIGFVTTYLAALSAGAVVTTVNPLWTQTEITNQLRLAGARWLASTPDLLTGKLSVPMNEAGLAAAFETDGVPRTVATTPAPPEPAAPREPEDPALLLSSSGTTGLPKLVVLSHRNLVASLSQTCLVHRVTHDDVVLAALPLFHIFGLQISLNLALLQGATVVLLPRFELAAFFRAIEEHRVTRSELVPPMVLGIAGSDLPSEHDVSSLRLLTSGAAPLSAELAQACASRAGCRVKQAYGLTEIAGASHITPDDGPERPASIGPPLPGVECRVVDPASAADLGAGEPGELLVRSNGVMHGYLGNPEATAATVDADGWLHTGDIVTVDEAGWYTVADRVKELIKYKGLSVAPAELEGVLLTHPAVVDAAVVRHRDAAAGEVPKAYVVLSAEVSEQELMSWVAQRVAPYKRVRVVEFTHSIPKSPSGKILRRLLIAQDGDGSGARRSS